jgi:hypothetical protein
MASYETIFLANKLIQFVLLSLTMIYAINLMFQFTTTFLYFLIDTPFRSSVAKKYHYFLKISNLVVFCVI